MRTRKAAHNFLVKHPESLILPAVLIMIAAIVALPLSSASSSSLRSLNSGTTSADMTHNASVVAKSLVNSDFSWVSKALARPMAPQGPGESIATFEAIAGVCTPNPKSSFNLGETVCAKVVGAPLGDGSRPAARIGWVSPYGSLAQGGAITTDPQNSFYDIPISATQTFTDSGGGTVTVDNRGTWRVGIYSALDGSQRETALFTVHDPTKEYVDLSVNQTETVEESQVTAGSSSVFELWVTNNGPDAAHSVVLTDTIPNNTTDTSITDHGSGFNCGAVDGGGVITCTLANFAAGNTAHLTFNYSVSLGTPAGTVLTNSVNVSSSATPCAPDSTCEIRPDDNSSTATASVPAGTGSSTCTLDCPDNVNAVANTTENGQRGAHVTFDAAEPSGTCGPLTATPASGSFFPVGPTTVTVTSDTGGGSCSFVVTVEDNGTNPPNITCPANMTASADSNCAATVNVGTATATGDNVTVFATRSDGKAMYTCDANGTNCVRRSSDDPFSAGVTTINWIAHSHNAPGPYADAADEEAHRTGAASCSQTITVNDTTPPVITATDSSASADASCQAAVPDYSNQVTDNCSCAASDTSQDCVGQHRITVTQDPAAGTMVGLGPHIIHLSANDGSSNNGGAGNTSTKDVTFTVNDTTAPTVTCPAPTSASADANCQAPVPDVTSGASASDNCSGSITKTQSPAAGTMVGLGPHTITVTATDAAGNQGTCTTTFTVNDTTPPTVSCPAPTSASANSSCQAPIPNVVPNVTKSDNCGSVTVTQSPAAGTMVGLGPHTITVTATDGSGNSSSCTTTFTVNDTTPPTITCPSNVTTNAEPGTCAAHVNPGTATATDNCDSSPTIVGTRSDGKPLTDTYPVGTTTITWTATDDFGNHSSCTQTVTVVDTQPPIITLNGQTPSMWPPNHKYQTFQVTNFVTSVNDNCGGSIPVSSVVITKVTSDELENSGGDGNTLNDIIISSDCKSVQLRSERDGGGDGRVYTIFFKVMDAHGNAGTATAKVVVQHNPGETAVDSGPHYTVMSSCP